MTSCGVGHIAAVSADGSVFMLGQNESGQCGKPVHAAEVNADDIGRARVSVDLTLKALANVYQEPSRGWRGSI